jgi:SH3-like domain-containing protein
MLKWITAAACLGATMAQAQSSALSGRQISDLVAGATVEIDTPLGTKLPIRYARDGRLSGEAGGLVSYLGVATDKGRWWVTSDQLCHKWNRWFGSEPQCMQLSKAGRIIHWRSQDGYTGTAMITVPPTIQAEAVALPPIPFPAQRGHLKRVDPREDAAAPASPHEEQAAPPAKDTDQPPQQTAEESAAQPAPAKLPAAEEPPAKGPPVQAAAAPSANPPQPQTEPRRTAQPAAPMFRVVNVRSDDVLNVRSGPSADFDIVAGLPPGSRGIAITKACRATWCPVRHGSTSGWVNTVYLVPEELSAPLPRYSSSGGTADAAATPGLRDSPDAPRACLTAPARALLDRIERQFGPVKVVSTCRTGAAIPGTQLPSRHASGNAMDVLAGSRKAAIVEWLIANHREGGTMTYAGMDHIHLDIGPHFVSIANGPRWLSWRDSARDFPGPQRAASGAH